MLSPPFSPNASTKVLTLVVKMRSNNDHREALACRFALAFVDQTKLITSAIFLTEVAHCSVPLMTQKELSFASFG